MQQPCSNKNAAIYYSGLPDFARQPFFIFAIMNIQVQHGILKGSVQLPSSKSLNQRALAAALLHHGTTVIHHAGHSNDDIAALSVIKELGAAADHDQDTLTISSNGIHPVSNKIHCEESGLSARLFIPLVALLNKPMTITGSGSLLQRPMDTFSSLLHDLNVSLTDFKGHLPFTVKGPLQLRDITVDGSISSQFLSGLLFAYAFTADKTYNIHVQNLKSAPYIDLTLQILARFGCQIDHRNYETFHIAPRIPIPEIIELTIEADWSSAAPWLVAGAMSGEINMEGLNLDSLQADRIILDILKETKAILHYEQGMLSVKHAPLHSFHFDATHCPDLFPVLAILATQCAGISAITGLHRLQHKESNRAHTIRYMLNTFGVQHSIENDTLVIPGKQTLNGGIIDSNNDHRIAMAAAIGALKATAPVTILHADAVMKSYPDFFVHLQHCGISTTVLS